MTNTVYSYPAANAAPRSAGDLVRVVTRAIVNDKRVASGVALWIFGLLAVFLLPGVPVSQKSLQQYQDKMVVTTQLEDRLSVAKTEMLLSEAVLNAERGWFPWFKSAAEKRKIANLRATYDAKKAVVVEAQRAWAQANRDANQQLGLFSRHGIEAARKHFWDSFEKGKIIGRRNTFWDGVFLVINRRYENMMEMVVQLAFYLVANMTAAMFLMFWFFTFGLPSLIWSLGGSWVGGTLFFFIAVVGAASVMLTFVALLSGSTAAAVYGLYSVVKYRLEAGESRAQIGSDSSRRRWQSPYRGDRPHVD